MHFTIGGERRRTCCYRYYGLPSLSWRDAAHDLLRNNVSDFTFEDIYFDKGHPNGYNGHRYVFAMLLSGQYMPQVTKHRAIACVQVSCGHADRFSSE